MASPAPNRFDLGKVTALVTAMTAVGALVFTGLSLRESRNQLAVAEQGQVTDRFTKAVEELGSDKFAVRIGGIYALERLGTDSPRDQATVADVLAAFVRDTALAGDDARCQTYLTPTSELGVRAPADVQAALTVLARRPDPDSTVIDLHALCLGPVAMPGANLHGADLERVNLQGAMFDRADLSDANMIESGFVGGSCAGCRLAGAKIDNSGLSNASLVGADLRRASLGATTLENADLSGADLTGADLNHADLKGANLTGATVDGADLTAAVLDGARTDGVKGQWKR